MTVFIRDKLYSAKKRGDWIRLHINSDFLNHNEIPFGEIVFLKKINTIEWYFEIRLDKRFRNMNIDEIKESSFVSIPRGLLSLESLKLLEIEDEPPFAEVKELDCWIKELVTG